MHGYNINEKLIHISAFKIYVEIVALRFLYPVLKKRGFPIIFFEKFAYKLEQSLDSNKGN